VKEGRKAKEGRWRKEGEGRKGGRWRKEGEGRDEGSKEGGERKVE
jgi:hypothetical protein